MTHARAMEIATQFMQKMNPDGWNGVGDQPASFDERIYEQPIENDLVIEIRFVDESDLDDEYGWTTIVEFVNEHGEPYGHYTCIDELNNIEGIADCIEYLCSTY